VWRPKLPLFTPIYSSLVRNNGQLSAVSLFRIFTASTAYLYIVGQHASIVYNKQTFERKLLNTYFSY
jgi:hypothetical protein